MENTALSIDLTRKFVGGRGRLFRSYRSSPFVTPARVRWRDEVALSVRFGSDDSGTPIIGSVDDGRPVLLHRLLEAFLLRFVVQYGIRNQEPTETNSGHLQAASPGKIPEEVILEFEGAGKNCDVTCWDLFADIKDIKKEILKCLEGAFREVA
jgi:hypothetical protein